MLNGIINIRKEAGYTSHDVVAKMRGICGQRKIGHTGTLDPAAEGVLPVCLGSATRLCELLTQKDKEYAAELLLGITTDTEDMTGQVLERREVLASEEEVRRAVLSFQGEYLQVPPMYSALKVDGKRLYELARAGREVERAPRPVTIHQIEIMEMELPVVKLKVVCSKGTYIRTLCADIGKALGCGGTMKSLLRTRSGSFGLEEAITLSQLERLRDEGRMTEALLPVDSVFSKCPALHVTEEFQKLLDNGNAFYENQTREGLIYPEGALVRIYREDESFAGVYAFDAARRRYQPVKMFL